MMLEARQQFFGLVHLLRFTIHIRVSGGQPVLHAQREHCTIWENLLNFAFETVCLQEVLSPDVLLSGSSNISVAFASVHLE
jgi:hypothetical protein